MLVIMTLALVGTVLAAANVWNPLPYIEQWWDKVTTLSEPEPRWTSRLGGVPDVAAVMASGQVVAATRGLVEAYSPLDGQPLWHYSAAWTLPAGDVVVIRQQSEHPDANGDTNRGYSVVDPLTGEVIWGDRDATAVWAFSDRIIDLTCPEAGDCRLRARRHRDDGAVVWTVSVPPGARAVHGADPELVGPRDPAEWFADAVRGSPGALPPVIGLSVEGRVQVIDTVQGTRVREVAAPDQDTWVSIVGDRVIFSRAEPADAGCRFRVEAFDYRTNASAWHLDGLDLNTASGVACEQRHDPLGAAAYLIAIAPDGKPMLIAAADGHAVWTGVPSERVLATDGLLAVVLAADRKTVRVLDILNPGAAPLWTGEMGIDPEAAVTPAHILIRDGDAGRVVVLSHFLGAEPQIIKTKAGIAGYGPRGLVVNSGRRIGFIPFEAAI